MPESSPRPSIRYFGDYTLRGVIARGGMGIVWQATHTALGRSCALKLIATGAGASPMERGRFLAEAEAAASLDHPNIVRVRHAGEFEGQFFLEMELVEGGTLAERLGEGAMTAREAAKMLQLIARAVHHAHERGVLHRDIKPNNVLLTPDGTPKLADFGIAKLLARSPELTSTFAILGTPAYLAPEAARGGARDSTVASDIYSLGSVLFELLTHRPPFVGPTALDILCQGQNTLPPHPRVLNSGIPADLEIICLRCLEPEPARRFPSAADLAEDLERFLGGQPIHSRPVSSLERLWRWSRRHPALALAISTALAAIIFGGGLVTWQWRRAEGLNYRLLEDLTTRRVTEAKAELKRGQTAIGLARLVRAARVAPWHSGAKQILHRWLKEGDLIAPVVTLLRASTEIESAEFAPGDRRVIAVRADNHGLLIDIASQKELLDVPLLKDHPRFIATATNSEVLVVHAESGALQQWRVKATSSDGVLAWSLPNVQLACANSPPTQCAAVDAAGQVWLSGLSSTNLPRVIGHFDSPVVMALNSTASLLAAADTNGAVTLWGRRPPEAAFPVDPDSSKAIQLPSSSGIPLQLLKFSPDGRWLLGVAHTNVIVWDLATGELRHNRIKHSGAISDVSFSHDSRWIATASYDGDATIWRSQDGSRVGEPFKHPTWVNCVRFSPTDHLLATTCSDGLVRLFATKDGRQLPGSATHELYVNTVEFAADGRSLLTASADRTARIWRLPEESGGQEATSVPGVVKVGIVTSPHSGLAMLSSTGELNLWDWTRSNRSPVRQFAGTNANANVLVWLPALDQFALGGSSTGAVQFVPRLASGVPHLPVTVTNRVTLLTSDEPGNRLLIGTASHSWLYDLREPEPQLLADFDFPEPFNAAFSPNGTRLVIASYNGTGRIFDAANGRPLGRLFDAGGPIQTVRFSPDSLKVMTASYAFAAHIWDATTGAALTPPLRHHAEATVGTFSAEGRWVATGGRDEAHLWDTLTGNERQAFPGISGYVRHIEFSPDQETLLLSTSGGKVQLFDVATGIEISGDWDLQKPNALVEGVHSTFAPGGEAILCWTDKGRVYAFPWPKPPPLQFLLEMGDWLAGRRFDDAGAMHLLGDSEISNLRLRLEAAERQGNLPNHLARYLH